MSACSAPVKVNPILSNRRHPLDYPSALKNDLSIGSGKIESAHRYVASHRLKRAEAQWRVDNTEGDVGASV